MASGDGDYPCQTVNEAARRGSLSELTRLITAGHPVDASDNQGWQPIHAAAAGNFTDCLIALLKHEDTDISWTSHEGYSSLYLAAEEGHIEAVKILLECGADINHKNSLDYYTPLHAAIRSCKSEMVKMLVDAGANLNSQNYTGSTPLHLAASEGMLDIVNILLSADAKTDVFEDYHISPIFSSAHFGHDQCLARLLEHIRIKGQPDLVSVGADDGGTPLYIAAQEGYTRCVKLLLDHGADANALTNRPIALPLHAALQFSRLGCVYSLLPLTDPSLLKYCDINPFDFATSHQNPACLQALIEGGLDVNYSHPLPDEERFELKVLSSGANNVIFKRTVSPLVSLVLYRHPLSNADILLKAFSSVGGKCGEVPPLIAALNERNLDYAKMLVSHGAPVDVFHPACCGNLSLISCLHFWKGFVFLLHVGADPTENFSSTVRTDMNDLRQYMDSVDENDRGSVIDLPDRNELRVEPNQPPLSFYSVLCQARQIQMARRGISVGMVLYQMLQYSGNVSLDPRLESLMEDPRDWKSLNEHTGKPRSLSHHCRLTIRRTIGPRRLVNDSAMYSLSLPETIVRYLLHKELYED